MEEEGVFDQLTGQESRLGKMEQERTTNTLEKSCDCPSPAGEWEESRVASQAPSASPAPTMLLLAGTER